MFHFFASHGPRLAAIVLVSASLSAQIPEGWGVASTFKQINYTVGGGGLTAFHPHRTEPTWQVTGLPADLTGVGVATTQVHGANCVLLDPTNRNRVLVGEVSLVANDQLDIYEVTLNGRAATGLVRHRIATRDPAARGMSIERMQWLPDGRVLFVHFGAMDPALGTSDLAILDLTSGAVTAVPAAGVVPGEWLALTLDANAGTAFVAVTDPAAGTSQVYSVPVPLGGVAQPLGGALPGKTASLERGDGGELLAGVGGRGIYRLTGGQWTLVSSTQFNFRGGLSRDPVTGAVLCRVDAGGVQELHRLDPNGATAIVHTLPGGSEVISDIAIAPSMRTYGTEMPGAYRWAIAPNLGGAPLVGNAGFKLEANAPTGQNPGGPSPGFLALGVQRANQPLLGFQLQIAGVEFWTFLPPSPVHSVVLPIPAHSGLIGATFFAQTVHATVGPGSNGQLVSSRGLELTVH